MYIRMYSVQFMHECMVVTRNAWEHTYVRTNALGDIGESFDSNGECMSSCKEASRMRTPLVNAECLSLKDALFLKVVLLSATRKSAAVLLLLRLDEPQGVFFLS